jgi:hypothetical protein
MKQNNKKVMVGLNINEAKQQKSHGWIKYHV